MASRSMADAVRAILVKRAFVPGGDPSMGGDPAAGGMPAPGGDPAAGGMPAPGGDPAAMGGDPAAMGVDPAAMGGMAPGADPMAGMPPVGADAGVPQQAGMINMTADEFTKFIKQMMAAFGQSAQPQQSQPDIGAKLDTLIAVLQGKSSAPVVGG